MPKSRSSARSDHNACASACPAAHATAAFHAKGQRAAGARRPPSSGVTPGFRHSIGHSHRNWASGPGHSDDPSGARNRLLAGGSRMARPGLEPGTPRFSVVSRSLSNPRRLQGISSFRRCSRCPEFLGFCGRLPDDTAHGEARGPFRRVGSVQRRGPGAVARPGSYAARRAGLAAIGGVDLNRALSKANVVLNDSGVTMSRTAAAVRWS
jgi:hypothetical protein